MNAIDALIAAGRIEDLVKTGKPGETIHIGERGAQCSSGGPTGAAERLHAEFAAAAPTGSRTLLWITRSPCGGRAMGEILVDEGKDTPAVVWAIEDGGKPRLDYETQRSVSFASASDRLETAADPLSLLGMVDHPRAEVAERLVRALGYQPVMEFAGDLRISFRTVALEPADA